MNRKSRASSRWAAERSCSRKISRCCARTAPRSIWLHCPVEELLHRCAIITDRPLFRDEASFRRLYEERLPAYEASDYRVDSSVEPSRVVEQILALGNFPAGDRMMRNPFISGTSNLRILEAVRDCRAGSCGRAP